MAKSEWSRVEVCNKKRPTYASLGLSSINACPFLSAARL
jgi:hypothetical protein